MQIPTLQIQASKELPSIKSQRIGSQTKVTPKGISHIGRICRICRDRFKTLKRRMIAMCIKCSMKF
jgi:hypothetical protein